MVDNEAIKRSLYFFSLYIFPVSDGIDLNQNTSTWWAWNCSYWCKSFGDPSYNTAPTLPSTMVGVRSKA